MKEYMKNKTLRFYFCLIFLFILPQFLIGIGFSYRFISDETSSKLFYFIRNLSVLTIFIFGYFFVLKQAYLVNKKFGQKVNRYFFIYFILSLIITSFYFGSPYTLISYLGYWITEIINYGGYQDNIYFALNYLFTGKIF